MTDTKYNFKMIERDPNRIIIQRLDSIQAAMQAQGTAFEMLDRSSRALTKTVQDMPPIFLGKMDEHMRNCRGRALGERVADRAIDSAVDSVDDAITRRTRIPKIPTPVLWIGALIGAAAAGALSTWMAAASHSPAASTVLHRSPVITVSK